MEILVSNNIKYKKSGGRNGEREQLKIWELGGEMFRTVEQSKYQILTFEPICCLNVR
jgi:hypothetical protein